MNTANRLAKLRATFAKNNIDGLFVTQTDNRFYMSGFSGSAGYLLITDTQAILATDFRYYEQVGMEAPGFQLFKMTGQVAEWFPQLIAECGMMRLGIEAADMTVDFHEKLAKTIKGNCSGLKLTPVQGIVESIRTIKEPEELALIKEAVKLTDRVFEHIVDWIRPGMTEKQVAWEVEKFHRENGSQTLPFEVIVQSGPNSAMPHAKPTDRKILEGEPIVIDMGGRIGYYSSDFTRTLCLGKPDATFRKIYDIVLGAQLTAISLIKEGQTGEEADGFARTVIKEAGHGDEFGHSLGHGIGLVAHESPRLGPRSTDILGSGMVFSIEPGIYIPGWGGVRIEDLAAIENGKLNILSKGKK